MGHISLQAEDREFIYNHLLEIETPLTSQELLHALVKDRILREKEAIDKQRSSGGDIYLPRSHDQVGQNLVFPGFGWTTGIVTNLRPGQNPDMGAFQVIQVSFPMDR